MERNTYLQLTDLAQAKSLWLDKLGALTLSPLSTQKVPLAEARGRTLSEPACALVSSPAFHGAAMDGIAVAAERTFGASEHLPKELIVGKDAFWINTGHPLPPGTNAVIMVENVFHATPLSPDAPLEMNLFIEKAAFPWQHVRKLGEDMVATEILLPPGTVIGAYELGALAAAGILRPAVFARPQVAVIPSGSELTPVEEATPELLASGRKLPEFNSLILSALVEDAGGQARIWPIVPDDPEKIRTALLEAAQSDADLLVINAGSSAGSHDFTAQIIAELGELWVHGINVMPGKPTALGRIQGKPVIGVPGYPISAIISFEEFGQPLLCLWQGRHMQERPKAAALPFQALPSRPGMEERIRVKLGQVKEKLIAVPLPRGAGTVTSLSRADGIIHVAPEVEGLPAGEETPVTLIRTKSQIAGALLAIGSHDNALDLLDSFLRRANPHFSLTSAHVGSLGGIMALKSGRCHLAGSHLLDAQSGTYNQSVITEQLSGIPVTLVRLADREQGLILPRGNPKNIQRIDDLARPDITFINRQRGSGTRVLLDWEMSLRGIKPGDIAGYANEEYTHMNVAVAVLSGRASTGLGVRAAANALGLDFIPVGIEEYDLIIPVEYWKDERMQALISVVRSQDFQKAMYAMGGYGVEKTGQVIWTFAG